MCDLSFLYSQGTRQNKSMWNRRIIFGFYTFKIKKFHKPKVGSEIYFAHRPLRIALCNTDRKEM